MPVDIRVAEQETEINNNAEHVQDPGETVHLNQAKRFAQGAIWSILGSGFSYFLNMVASIITAHLLGRMYYGELGIINNTIATLGEFAGLGLGLTAAKYVAEYRKVDPDRAGRIIGLNMLIAIGSGTLLCLLTLLNAHYISSTILNAPRLAGVLCISSILLILNTLNGVQSSSLTGFEAFRSIAWTNLVRGVVNFAVIITLVKLAGLTGAVCAAVITTFVSCTIFQICLRRQAAQHNIHISLHGLQDVLPTLWQFSLPAFLTAIVVIPMQWLANIILVHQPNGYSEMGHVNVAYQWRALLIFLPMVLLQVSLPMMSSAIGEGDADKQYTNTFALTQNISTIAVLPLGALLMFGTQLILKLYGKDFTTGGDLVLIGIIAGVMYHSIASAVGSALQSKAYMWKAFSLNAVWGGVLVLCVKIFAPTFGAGAIGIGFGIAYLVLAIQSCIYIRRLIPGEYIYRMYASILFVTLLTLVALLLPSFIRSILAIPIALFAGFLSLRFFVRDEVRQLLFRSLSAYIKRLGLGNPANSL